MKVVAMQTPFPNGEPSKTPNRYSGIEATSGGKVGLQTPHAPHDQWTAMCAVLWGDPPPPLPDIPGRHYGKAPIPEADPYADAWDAINSRIPNDPKGIP